MHIFKKNNLLPFKFTLKFPKVTSLAKKNALYNVNKYMLLILALCREIYMVCGLRRFQLMLQIDNYKIHFSMTPTLWIWIKSPKVLALQ